VYYGLWNLFLRNIPERAKNGVWKIYQNDTLPEEPKKPGKIKNTTLQVTSQDSCRRKKDL
jgi:hypothetical protein